MMIFRKILNPALCILMSGILLGCAKGGDQVPDINSCYIEKDKLLTEYSKTYDQLAVIKSNVESEVMRRTLARQKELNTRIESYNQYIIQINQENQAYRSRLRNSIIVILLGILACIAMINVVLFKYFLKTKPSKKIYEE